MQRNRSERRAIFRAEAKQLKKEEKRMNKGNKFNSKKSGRPIEYKKYKDSLFPVSDSTDTFTVEYIHLAPEYDDSQEGESDLDDITHLERHSSQDRIQNTPRKIDFIHVEKVPSLNEEQPCLEDHSDIPDNGTALSTGITDTETQGPSNADVKEETRSIHSTKSRSKRQKDKQSQSIRLLVLTADGPEEPENPKLSESGVGSDGSEDRNQCTFLSLSEDTTRSCRDTSVHTLEKVTTERNLSTPSVSSVSTLSVVEQESEINKKSQSVYNHELPFLSGETLKPSGKKKNVIYRMFKKKSEKILDKLSTLKVVEEKKSKRSWKVWKKLSLPTVS